MHSFAIKGMRFIPVLALLCAAVACTGDFQKGLEAFNNGDYVTAMTECMPLSTIGDLNAMYNIGLLYDEGLGVDRV